MSSIFPTLGIDRNKVRWEDYLTALTPWEQRGGLWFKREDYFAPLGYGGPNGSKMRQLIWYINRFRAGKTRLLTGASVQSPQLSMSAIVGAHFGLRCQQVVYSKPNSVLRHANPQIAAGFGADFVFAAAPYNPVIQRKVDELRSDDALVVEYGITVPHKKYPAADVRGFHETGAAQVQNLPPEVRTLIVPAGSCNSLTSILLGLSQNAHNLQTLFTVGIGPDKREWVLERLAAMGVDPAALRFRWQHHSLHDTGFSAYSDYFEGESYEGINFHPTYEAKIWRFLRQHLAPPLARDGTVGFWIVGALSHPDVVRPYFTHAA
jgi:1-aminocyclopropane-1-carboxylate deaminase/D-cysteine desulfhydrase-like pyridoxal-dependent ACC family enzyme